MSRPKGPPPPEYDIVFRRTSYDALLEAFLSVDAAQWRRRAADLEAARPRRADFHGRSTRAELSARWNRLSVDAMACRARAELVEFAAAEFADTLTDLGGPAA